MGGGTCPSVAGSQSVGSGPKRRLAQWLKVSHAFQPSVSNDGREILFLSDRSGLPQAWRTSVSGGTARRLSQSTERVGRVDASPSSPRAVLSRDAGGNEAWQLELIPLSRAGTRAASRARALTSDPKVMNLPFGWMEDGRRYLFSSNARDSRFFDVYSIDVDTRAPPEQIWSGDGWQMAAATRGDRILVLRYNTFLNVDLFLLDSGKSTHLNPHRDEVSVSSCAIGTDGVYVATNPGRELLALFRYPFDGSSPELVREFPGEVELVRAPPDGEALGVVVNRDGWSELHVLECRTGADRRLAIEPRGVITELEWFPDGNTYAIALSWPNGSEIFLGHRTGGRIRRITQSPVRTPARVPDPRLRSVTAEDGLEIPYFEHRGGARSSRGVLLWVHGGPEGQARPGFDPALGFVLSEGWTVIQPNIRGSTGYGRTYVHLDDVRKRMDSIRDLRDIANALIRSGTARTGRIGIIGGSYGGFAVLSAITTYPDLWGAAVDFFGIANFVTFLERTAEWRRTQREAEYGSLKRDRAFLKSISPIHQLERVRTPLLVLHGRNDPRVPIGEAEQITAALQKMGRPVELLTFDNEGHGFVHRENQLESWNRSMNFMAKYLDARGSRRASRK
jgi:dipeptidyl aminopeptidase/acylaminoacyl peptidase